MASTRTSTTSWGAEASEFVKALAANGRCPDAMDFLAHALSKRDAVWWACLAAKRALGAALSPVERAALIAAAAWVLDPDERKRRAAETAGDRADFGSLAGSVAFAVYGSGGSLAPADLPDVPPDHGMTARAVSASVMLASVRGQSQSIEARQRELVDLGVSIAEGRTSYERGHRG